MENREDIHSILRGYNMLLLFAGSMVMYEPTRECIVDFWKNGLLKQLPVKSKNPRFVNAASLLRESVEDETLSIKTLRDDYNRLFPGDQKPLVPVNESVYNDFIPRQTIKKTENVSEFYDSYGWVSKLRGKIPDDHLGIEILFLTRLIEKYLALDDEPCRIEMRGEIRRFIDQHLLLWIPRWNEQMQEHAATLCYKGIGSLIQACIEDINNLLSHPENPMK